METPSAPVTIAFDEPIIGRAGWDVDGVKVLGAVARLTIRSGRVVAGDPCYIATDVDPFDVVVAPGTYPVDLVIATFGRGGADERVASARIRLTEARTARLTPAKPASAGVDSGTWCFADAAVRAPFADSGVWEPFYESLCDALGATYRDTREWGEAPVPGTDGLNVVAFSSGFGDGGYDNYYAYDEQGNLVAIVSDFGLLDTDADLHARSEKRWWQFWR